MFKLGDQVQSKHTKRHGLVIGVETDTVLINWTPGFKISSVKPAGLIKVDRWPWTSQA